VTARGDRRVAWILLAPALAVLGTVTVYPIVRVIVLSLERRVPIFGIADFVGLANYAFLVRDGAFWGAIRVTAVFTLASVAAELVLGVAAAVALRAQRRGVAVSLSLLLLPWCLPGVVTGRIFEWIYHPSAGLVNRLVSLIVATQPNWLGDSRLALPAVVAADVWRTTPFIALLVYARLATVPAAVYEAAAVDGAGRAATFWRITLPLLRPVLLVALLFRTLDAVRAFDLMFILTGGGPAGVTETLTLYAYRSLFQTLQLGFGSASAVVVGALVVALAWGQLAATRERDAA
jgi:trehalose/maltose transport system permease protein